MAFICVELPLKSGNEFSPHARPLHPTDGGNRDAGNYQDRAAQTMMGEIMFPPMRKPVTQETHWIPFTLGVMAWEWIL